MPRNVVRSMYGPSRKRARPYRKAGFASSVRPRRAGLMLFSRPVYMPRGYALPLRLQNTMTFGETLSITNTDTGGQMVLYRSNSIFQPSLTNADRSPRYYDQLAALYSTWVVTRSKITVTPVANGSIGGVTTVVTTASDPPDFAVGSQVNLMREWPGAQYGTACLTGGQVRPVVNVYNPRVAAGGDVVDHDGYSGHAASSPTDGNFFIITMRPENTAFLTGTRVDVKIEFTVIWSDLQQIGAS